MKLKFTFLFTLIFCGQILLSQNVFPDNNAVWKTLAATIAGGIETYVGLCGDTLIDGRFYNRMEQLTLDSAFNVSDKTFLGGVRSEGEVVYYFQEGEAEEVVLYDFGLEEGDSIVLDPIYAFVPITRYVDSVRVLSIAGADRKVIYFEPGASFAPVEIWIEGIGSNFGPIYRAIDPGFDYGWDLLCFLHGAEYLNLTLIECFLPELNDCPIINSVPEKENLNFSIFPNPTFDKVFIESKNGSLNNLEINLFSLDGRLVGKYLNQNGEKIELDLSGQSCGIYFLEIKNKLNQDRLGFSKIIKMK